MSFSFPFYYEKELFLRQNPETVIAFLRDYNQALPSFFPGLSRFEQQDSKRYLWEFEALQYGGKQLAIKFKTFFEESPDRIQVLPDSDSADTTLNGEWRVLPATQGSQLKMHFQLDFTVPLPRLMKAVVTPLASAELTKLFDRYAENIQKHFK